MPDVRMNSHMSHEQVTVACEALVLRIVQHSRDTSQCSVVGLVSPHPGAGVTRITHILADTLRSEGNQGVVAVSASDILGSASDPGVQSGAATLDALRQMYRFVLIDCGSIRHRQNAIRLIPQLDGVILVVEANKTSKEQLLYSERVIENLDGRILGHVLNKRTYVVPGWLYGLMETAGV
jgi:hypothetical protein